MRLLLKFKKLKKGIAVTRRNEGKLALIMIVVLIAFIIGSAIGISVSIGEHDNQTNENNTTHVENVTTQMTTNVDNNNSVPFDYDKDAVDYNENNTDGGV